MPFSRTRGVCWIGSLLLAVWGNSGHAAGLGSIVVQSGLGQPLRASVSLIGTNNGDPGIHCIRARVASIDGSISMTPKVGLVTSAGAPTIQIVTAQNVNELALNVFVAIGCDISVQRTYQILIDPAVALPTVEESREPATQPDESAVTPMPAATFVSENPSVDRASKHRTPSSSRARSRETAPDRDAAPFSENKKPESHHKTAKHGTHSVLKMSGLDTPIEDLLPDPGLKMSDQLSTSAEIDPQKLAEIKQEQARFAAYLRGEDPALTAEERLKAAQAEVEKLSAELARDNVRRKSDQAALESTQTESHKWIRSLQVLLAICLAALAWLLWRFYAIKRDETYTSWRDLLGEHKDGAETTTSQLGENSSFNTSTFGSFDTGTSTFGTGAFSTTDISTFIPTTESPATTEQADAPRESQQPAGTPPETHRTMRGVPKKEKPEATPEAEPVPFRYDTAAHMPYTRLQQTETRNHDPENALKAEEISDVMELANVWMALHDPQKVLELLEPFSGVEQPESPLPWLCLLDVYHSIGDREKYEAILERIKKIYNVRLAPWDTEADAEPPKTLADFPHIVDTVLNLWEGDGVIPYLDELMKDNREGTRQGFDLPVYRDLIKLLTLAKSTQPRKREDAEREIADAISSASHRRQVALDAATRSKPAIAAPEVISPEPSSSGRKPQLRERPKYITTSYQRNLSSRGNAPVAERKPDSTPAAATEDKPDSEQEVLVEPVDVTVITHEASASIQSADEETTHDYDSMSPMAIKLHLAIAYVDIGDKEGALLLLEEVVHGGNAEQIEQAKSLLTTLR